MESQCVRQTAIPGTSRLYADFLYSFQQVERFYGRSFQDENALLNTARSLSFPAERRAELVAALRETNPGSQALDRLAQPDSVAVVTGQQVGLLSGPVYTIYKALTAARLAQELRMQGVNAVPVFWLATEDHDLAEVDHTWLFNESSSPSRVAVRGACLEGIPVGRVPICDLSLNAVKDALGELPFASEVLELLARHYREGATFGSAFRSFLQELLQPFDLVFLDPLTPGVRKLAKPFLENAISKVGELNSALRERGRELDEAGYHQQVHVDATASLFFLLEDDRRTALRYRDGRFLAKDQSLSVEELGARAEQLSPNALLRPVMQDYLLPTVTYVGGPAEIAYFAQSQVLYQKLLGRMPILHPRNSFTLLDARASKLLDHYQLHLTDLYQSEDQVRATIAARLVPTDLRSEFTDLRFSLTSSVSSLREKLLRFDPTLAAATDKSLAKISYQLEKLSAKTARETMRRDEYAARDSDYLAHSLYPQRHPQERFYSVVPFLAKYGLDLPQRLFDEVQLTCPDHMVRNL